MRDGKLRTAAALGLAMLLAPTSAPEAYKRKPLTEVDKGIRGFLWERTAKTRVQVATQANLLAPVEIYTNAGPVTLYTLHTDVDRSGRVSFEGRTMLGMKVKIEPHQVPRGAREGTEFEITGYTLKDDRIAIALKKPRGTERASIRLWLGDGFQSHMDAGELIEELFRVLDFGPDAARFSRLRAERERVDRRLAAEEAEFQDGSRDIDHRIAIGERFGEALREAARVHGEYDAMTNTQSRRNEELRRLQTELGEQMAKLANVRLALLRNEIGDAMRAFRVRLAEADARFRDPSSNTEERLETAASIVDSLQQIRRRCDKYQELGGDELEAEAGIQRALAGFSGWLDRSRSALEQGCLREEGLSANEIARLLAVPAPDAAVAREIERCGVAFEPNDEVVGRLVAAGLGGRARAALAAGEPSRLARADLPSLDEVMAGAAQALDSAPPATVVAVGEVESTGRYDAGTQLYWSDFSRAELDHFDAERFCKKRAGGWRMPAIEELERLGRGSQRHWLGRRVAWSGTTRSKSSAWAYDATAGKKEKVRRKFSLRQAVCVRSG